MRSSLAAVLASFTLVVTSAAMAAPIKYVFTGTTDYVDPSLRGAFPLGQTFTASILYDPNTPTNLNHPPLSIFDLLDLETQYGGFNPQNGGPFGVKTSLLGDERILFQDIDYTEGMFSEIGGVRYHLGNVTITLIDQDESFIHPLETINELPALSSFEVATWHLQVSDLQSTPQPPPGRLFGEISGRIVRIDRVDIPAPGMAASFAVLSGCVLVFAFRPRARSATGSVS